MFMQKRSLRIFYALNLSLILYITSLLFFQFAFSYLNSTLFISISIVMVYIALWSLCFSLITKNWMIYYKYKWTFYTFQHQWQQHINPEMSKESNWFIIHHKTYGNLHYFSRLFGSICILSFILTLTAALITVILDFDLTALIIATIMILFTISPLVLIYIMLVHKTPPFFDDDEFKIHWESKIHSKLLGVFVILLIAFDTCLIILGDILKVCIIGFPILSIPFVVMVYVSTVIVSTKNKIKYLSLTDRISEGQEIDTTAVKLDMIFKNEDAFYFFMTHLSKEYSMEVLLSTIEFMQYQNYLKPLVQDKEVLDSIKNIEFYDNVPESMIVSSVEDDGVNMSKHESLDIDIEVDGKEESDLVMMLHRGKIKANQLYQKYIKWGSEFEINIGSVPRLQLKNQLENLDSLMKTDMCINELILLFEEAKSDQLRLLRHSLNRYRYLDEFDKVLSIFQPKSHDVETSVIFCMS